MNFLVDENLSPRLVTWLHTLGHPAEHVVHRGLGSSSDPVLWAHAFEHDQIVITVNARDFLELAGQSQLHAGLIILRSEGLSSEEQRAWIASAVEFLNGQPEGYLVNRVLEVHRPGRAALWIGRSPDRLSKSLSGLNSSVALRGLCSPFAPQR